MKKSPFSFIHKKEEEGRNENGRSYSQLRRGIQSYTVKESHGNGHANARAVLTKRQPPRVCAHFQPVNSKIKTKISSCLSGRVLTCRHRHTCGHSRNRRCVFVCFCVCALFCVLLTVFNYLVRRTHFISPGKTLSHLICTSFYFNQHYRFLRVQVTILRHVVLDVILTLWKSLSFSISVDNTLHFDTSSISSTQKQIRRLFQTLVVAIIIIFRGGGYDIVGNQCFIFRNASRLVAFYCNGCALGPYTRKKISLPPHRATGELRNTIIKVYPRVGRHTTMQLLALLLLLLHVIMI